MTKFNYVKHSKTLNTSTHSDKLICTIIQPFLSPHTKSIFMKMRLIGANQKGTLFVNSAEGMSLSGGQWLNHVLIINFINQHIP